MNGRLLLTTLLASTFFLVMLGMRIPSLEQKLCPKQRPRAVFENVNKSSMVELCKLQLDIDLPPAVATKSTPAEVAPLTLPVIYAPPAPLPASLSCRAPPLFSSLA